MAEERTEGEKAGNEEGGTKWLPFVAWYVDMALIATPDYHTDLASWATRQG